MTQPLSVAFAEIYSSIPLEILKLAFLSNNHIAGESIDESIKKNVIDSRVLADVNITTGGRPAKIPLLLSYIETSSELISQWIGPGLTGDLFRIPAAAREGRDIRSVERIEFAYVNSMHDGVFPHPWGYTSANNTMNLSNAMLASRTFSDADITPTVIKRDGNIIQITPRYMTDGMILHCKLDYDPEFTNMPEGSINTLSELILCAVKGYIYTRLAIQVDQAQMMGGGTIGRIRDFIDKYEQEGSKEIYRELLDKLKGGAILDPEVFITYVRHAI